MSTLPIVEGHVVNNASSGGYKSGAPVSYQSNAADYIQVDGNGGAAVAEATPDLRMNPPKQFQDVIWGVLFLGHLAAMVVLCVLVMVQNGEGIDQSLFSVSILSLVGIAAAVSMVLSTAALTFMMSNPELLIKIALVLSVLSSLAVGAMLLMSGSVMFGCLAMASFAIGCCYAKLVWHRIPFAAATLRTALSAVSSNLGLGLVALVFLGLGLAWTVVWFRGLGSALGENTLVVVFLLFLSLYWVHQVLQNTMHVTTAGVIGTWWFVPEEANSFCSSALSNSALRATTYSFGSICFGSFVVAVVKALRTLESYTRGQEDMQLVSCLIQCILGCIEHILEYFNKWAYVYVGLYGFSYLEAGKNVIQLFKNRGWTAIINDDLCDNVLWMMSIAIGLGSGVVGLIFGLADEDMFADMGVETGAALPAFFMGFLVGYVIATVLLSIVSSAVNTVIVCYAEAPAEFEANYPTLSSNMRNAWTQAYPGLMQ